MVSEAPTRDRLTRCVCGHFKTEHAPAPRVFRGALWCTAELVREDDDAPITCACMDFLAAESPAHELQARSPLAGLVAR